MNERFSGTCDQVAGLLCIVPKVMEETGEVEERIKALGATYGDDLPNPLTFSADIRKWRRRWAQSDAASRPDSPSAALQVCDVDVYPNIHCLLRIACTLPVTSAENERCHSSLKRLKTYLRTTMGTERLSSLALMQVYRSVPVDFEQVVTAFA
eukprot:scpid93658/ scgid7126/ 52 kDa repressor of the inhibitor of the protein kinase; 58 kDa interferon-induced protein kinase-interacting protein; Death-associated protein 4; THAP domain-containing protein 0